MDMRKATNKVIMQMCHCSERTAVRIRRRVKSDLGVHIVTVSHLVNYYNKV